MATKPKDPQFIRTRKMATFLPVVGVPFLAVMFYLGGGGGGTPADAQVVPAGFNTNLPGVAGNTDITTSKIEAYSAPVDSLRNRGLVSGQLDTASTNNNLSYAVGPNGETGPNASADKTVAAAQQQLLDAQQAQQAASINATPTTVPGALTPQEQRELDRSERERKIEEARAKAEIARLLRESDERDAPKPVAVAPVAKSVSKKPATKALIVDDNAIVSRLGAGSTKRTVSFQGLDDSGSADAVDANTLPAVIHESQEVVSGSLVKMRLTEPAVVNGHQLAANTFIYGKCSLAGERLTIAIETLKSGGSIFPASLEVYDVDGLEGLHIPGTITRDASKQAGADAMGAADMMTMSADPTTAAAGVAVTAVKSLGQKKVRLVKVRLKAGYNILLKVDKED